MKNQYQTVSLLVMLTLTCYVDKINGFIDVYLRSDESYRIFGTDLEVYALRNGVPSRGLTNFQLPATILRFDLTVRIRTTPPNSNVVVVLKANDTSAIGPFHSTSNYSSSRFTLPISVKCLSSSAGPVMVNLRCQFGAAGQAWVLDFNLTKVCHGKQSGLDDLLMALGKLNLSSSDIKDDGLTNSSLVLTNSSFVSRSAIVFYVSVGCACLLIVLVAFGLAAFYMRIGASSKAAVLCCSCCRKEKLVAGCKPAEEQQQQHRDHHHRRRRSNRSNRSSRQQLGHATSSFHQSLNGAGDEESLRPLTADVSGLATVGKETDSMAMAESHDNARNLQLIGQYALDSCRTNQRSDDQKSFLWQPGSAGGGGGGGGGGVGGVGGGDGELVAADVGAGSGGPVVSSNCTYVRAATPSSSILQFGPSASSGHHGHQLSTSVPDTGRSGGAGGNGSASVTRRSSSRRSRASGGMSAVGGSGAAETRHHQRIPLREQLLLEGLNVGRDQVELGEIQMEGTLGQVLSGVWREGDEGKKVMIKTANQQANDSQVSRMLAEAAAMRRFKSSPYISPLLAVCLADTADNNDGNLSSSAADGDSELQRPLLLYAFLGNGNLKKFLQRCRASASGNGVDQPVQTMHTLNTQQLVYMALQVLRGLQYLHKRRFVHRDIATRNCAVNTDLRVCITDCALSRDLFPADYQCLGDNENRPVKWLAIEALSREKHFTFSSDIWAYGVFLWELLTLAQQPYLEVDPFEMLDHLRAGMRMVQPANCPDELYSIMAWCWAASVAERPRISQLQYCLNDFYQALSRFI